MFEFKDKYSFIPHMQWEELPTELRRDLSNINLQEINNLQQRLQDRRRANILSYLHLCSLRLTNEETLKQRFYSNIENFHEMRTCLQLVTNAQKIYDT